MRITGGSARGRNIKVPDTGTVRPTSDRMRQQLFNMLNHSIWATQAMFDLEDAHVLDGFCGSGALGIEALSRGAASCVFVDFDGRVLNVARANVKICGFDGVSQFIQRGCQSLAARPAGLPARNLVLLDPPYRKDLIAPALVAMHEGGWIAGGAVVIAESESSWQGADLPEIFMPLHVRAEGDSALNIWQYGAHDD